jgi:hypothetical protein
VVTDAEFGREEDHGSTLAITIGRRLEPLDAIIDPEPD